MKYYRRNMGDYAASTRHLSILEHGVYTLLLDLYYTREAPIPAGAEAACRAIGARSAEEKSAVEAILGEFFTPTEGGWSHSACEKLIAVYREKAATARQNGTKGGRKSVPKTNQQETNIGSFSVPIPKAIHKPKDYSVRADGSAVENSGSEDPPEESPNRAVYAEARRLMGESAGGLIAKQLGANGKGIGWCFEILADIDRRRLDPEAARAYFSKAAAPKVRGFVC